MMTLKSLMARAFKSIHLSESWRDLDRGSTSAKYIDELGDIQIVLSNPSANYDMSDTWWRVLIKPAGKDVNELTPDQISRSVESMQRAVKKYNITAIDISGQHLKSYKQFASELSRRLGWEKGSHDGEMAISQFGFGPQEEIQLSNGWILKGPKKRLSKINSLKRAVEKSGMWETGTELQASGKLKDAADDYEIAFDDYWEIMSDNDINLIKTPLRKP